MTLGTPLLTLAALAGVAAPSDDQPAMLRDWTLTRCLAKGYGAGTRAGADASRAAAALLERGLDGMTTYERLDRLVDRQLRRRYAGSTGGTYATLKCLDLYHSAALAQAVRAPRTPNR